MANADFLKVAPTAGDGFDLATGQEAPRAMQHTFGAWIDAESVHGAPVDLAGFESDRDLEVLQGLHALAIKGFRDMVETFAQVRDDDDPSLNADARLKIAVRIVEPRLNTLAELAEREFARVDASIAEEEAKIAKASRQVDALDIAIQSDIRAHLRTGGAVAAVYAALAEGDLQTLQAVATAPPHMSGLKGGTPTPGVVDGASAYAEAQAAVRAMKAPQESKRVHALKAGRAVALHAVGMLGKKAEKFLDFKRARELNAKEEERSARYGVGA
jgi:hypothetical protein